MLKRTIRRAVVTGAGSMLGAAVTGCLLEQGAAVTAVLRPGGENAAGLSEETPGLTIVRADLSAPEAIPGEGIDAWFHFAWAGTYGEGRHDAALQKKNAAFSVRALLHAKELGVRVFFFAGSQAEYGPVEGVIGPDTPLNPVTEYGKGKLLAEREIREISEEIGIDAVFARILSVYGPYDHDYTLVMSSIGAFLSGEEMAFTPGEQDWDYLYSEDAAKAIIRIAEAGVPGKAYPLGSGKTRKLRDYIRDIRDEANPDAPLSFGGRDYPPGQVMHLSADISDLIRDTGYTPDTGFLRGIRKTIEYYREKRR